jgi:hypothetical protein
MSFNASSHGLDGHQIGRERGGEIRIGALMVECQVNDAVGRGGGGSKPIEVAKAATPHLRARFLQPFSTAV